MSAKVHVLLKCGRVHHKRSKSRQVGRRCCYVAFALHETGQRVVWETEFLEKKNPFTRSTVDRKNGNNPIWNDHLQFTTNKLADLTISLRDETIFQVQPRHSTIGQVHEAHTQIASCTIPMNSLSKGNLYIPPNPATALSSKAAAAAARANRSRQRQSRKTAVATPDRDNAAAMSHINDTASSPNKKLCPSDVAGFFPIKLHDAAGRVCATIWARIQIQYPFSIVVPPTMRSRQVLSAVELPCHQRILLLSFHHVKFVPRAHKHWTSLKENVPQPKPPAIPMQDSQHSLPAQAAVPNEFHMRAEVDARDPAWDARMDLLCQTTEPTTDHAWKNQHFWVPLERGQTWVKCTLYNSRGNVASGVLQLRNERLVDARKYDGCLWLSKRENGRSIKEAQLYFSAQLQFSSSIILPPLMNTEDLAERAEDYLMDEPKGAPPVFFRKYTVDGGFVRLGTEDLSDQLNTGSEDHLRGGSGIHSSSDEDDEGDCPPYESALLSPKSGRMMLSAKSSFRSLGDSLSEKIAPESIVDGSGNTVEDDKTADAKADDVVEEPPPLEKASKQKRSPGQLLTHLQRDVAVIPATLMPKCGELYHVDFFEPGSTGLHVHWAPKKGFLNSPQRKRDLVDAPAASSVKGQALAAGTIRTGDALLAVGKICVQDLRDNPNWSKELFQTHLQPRPLRVWFLSRKTTTFRELRSTEDAHVPSVLRTIREFQSTPSEELYETVLNMDMNAVLDAADALGLDRCHRKREMVTTIFHRFSDIISGNFEIALPPVVPQKAWNAVKLRVTLRGAAKNLRGKATVEDASKDLGATLLRKGSQGKLIDGSVTSLPSSPDKSIEADVEIDNEDVSVSTALDLETPQQMDAELQITDTVANKDMEKQNPEIVSSDLHAPSAGASAAKESNADQMLAASSSLPIESATSRENVESNIDGAALQPADDNVDQPPIQPYGDVELAPLIAVDRISPKRRYGGDKTKQSSVRESKEFRPTRQDHASTAPLPTSGDTESTTAHQCAVETKTAAPTQRESRPPQHGRGVDIEAAVPTQARTTTDPAVDATQHAKPKEVPQSSRHTPNEELQSKSDPQQTLHRQEQHDGDSKHRESQPDAHRKLADESKVVQMETFPADVEAANHSIRRPIHHRKSNSSGSVPTPARPSHRRTESESKVAHLRACAAEDVSDASDTAAAATPKTSVIHAPEPGERNSGDSRSTELVTHGSTVATTDVKKSAVAPSPKTKIRESKFADKRKAHAAAHKNGIDPAPTQNSVATAGPHTVSHAERKLLADSLDVPGTKPVTVGPKRLPKGALRTTAQQGKHEKRSVEAKLEAAKQANKKQPRRRRGRRGRKKRPPPPPPRRVADEAIACSVRVGPKRKPHARRYLSETVKNETRSSEDLHRDLMSEIKSDAQARADAVEQPVLELQVKEMHDKEMHNF